MTIQHTQSAGKGVFFIKENEVTIAELTYSIVTYNQLIIEHTQVDETIAWR